MVRGSEARVGFLPVPVSQLRSSSGVETRREHTGSLSRKRERPRSSRNGVSPRHGANFIGRRLFCPGDLQHLRGTARANGAGRSRTVVRATAFRDSAGAEGRELFEIRRRGDLRSAAVDVGCG